MAVRSGLYMPSGYKIAPALVIMFIMIMVCDIAGAVYSSHMDIISKKQNGRIRINRLTNKTAAFPHTTHTA